MDPLAIDQREPLAGPDGLHDRVAHHLEVERPGSAQLDDPGGGPLGLHRDVAGRRLDEERFGIFLGQGSEVHGRHVVAERGAGDGGRMRDHAEPVPVRPGQHEARVPLADGAEPGEDLDVRLAQVGDLVDQQDGPILGAEPLVQGLGRLGVVAEAGLQAASQVVRGADVRPFQGDAADRSAGSSRRPGRG